MPHVLTRTRAVVGGGILAVLLWAWLGAPAGAQTPDKIPYEQLRDVSGQVTQVATFTEEVVAGATGADLLMSSGSCRDSKLKVEGYKYGVRVYAVTSNTRFCWDGTYIVEPGPRFVARREYLHGSWYQEGDTQEKVKGGVGKRYHWDYARWKFRNDWGGMRMAVWIEKEQKGTGTATARWGK